MHLDFLSILTKLMMSAELSSGFNPYSPGFSIYFKCNSPIPAINVCFNPYSPGFSIYLIESMMVLINTNCFNPYSPGFSIYLQKFDLEYQLKKIASILIHLDFLSISNRRRVKYENRKCFNPYSPGFSIYLH